MPTPTYLMVLVFAGFFVTAVNNGRYSGAIERKAGFEDSLIGDWTGTSKCQVRNSPCRDENVIFHFSPGNGADLYKVRADKIVNGQAVDMGELDFKLERGAHRLTCTFPNGTWVLVVDKNHIDGTLTTPDKVLFRKLSLSKTE